MAVIVQLISPECTVKVSMMQFTQQRKEVNKAEVSSG